jgi:hypothetical protein
MRLTDNSVHKRPEFIKEIVMLSLFLNVKNPLPGGAVPDPPTDEDRDYQAKPGPADDRLEAGPGPGIDAVSGDLSDLLSIIIANGEFLEIVYGENRHLKNILAAAAAARRHLQDELAA